MLRTRTAGCIFLVAFVVLAPIGLGIHDRFVVYFPQVAKGILGNQVEIVIVVSNPGTESLDVVLNSDLTVNPPLLAKTVFQLEPGQTREVKISGDELRVGWVRLESSKVVSAAAHILTRLPSGSRELISQVTILPQKPGLKVSIPVFRRTGGSVSGQEVLADNTGIAIASVQPGRLVLTLRDSAGNIVSTRSVLASSSNPSRDFVNHIAAFVTELFLDLPNSFSAGSLTIEHGQPEPTARAFAVTAIYTKDDQMWGAGVASVDVPGGYLVKFKSGQNVQQSAKEMAGQYGFTVKEFLSLDTALIVSTDAVAEALARDPRIERVNPNTVIEVAG